MKDKRAKQIEEEAKKRLSTILDKLPHVAFIEGAEYGYSLAEINIKNDAVQFAQWLLSQAQCEVNDKHWLHKGKAYTTNEIYTIFTELKNK